MTSSTRVIILATVIPVVVGVVLVVLLLRYRRKRNARLFNRGITPIADEEIESWKTDRNDEKELIPEKTSRSHQERSSRPQSSRHHKQHSSVSSLSKPASVIVYQNAGQGLPRTSGEQTPKSLLHSRSMDLPTSPILARAPNARPGLTDEMIQGDDAFIPQVKRQSSRLSKGQHQRHRSAYGVTGVTGGRSDRWYGQDVPDLQSRKSADNINRRDSAAGDYSRTYSMPGQPPRMSMVETSLPRVPGKRAPLEESEIGRAIG